MKRYKFWFVGWAADMPVTVEAETLADAMATAEAEHHARILMGVQIGGPIG